jgi:hypothetical protein
MTAWRSMIACSSLAGLVAALPPAASALPLDTLHCFKVSDPAAKTQYVADLVPGNPDFPLAPGCRIKVPAKLLCLEADAENVTPPPPGAPAGSAARPYLCYKAKCTKAPLAVPVADRFGSRTVQLKSSNLVCVPADAAVTVTTTTSSTSTTVPAMGLVRFVAMGDTGKGDASQYQVAGAVAAKCAASGCDFVQLLGDNIYNNGVDSVADGQWNEKFELPYAALPYEFFAILGNHDYGGDGAGYEVNRALVQVAYTAVSTKWRMPATYYQRVVGHVAFFALDSNAQMWSPGDPTRDAAQRADVAAWLAASGAPWKISLGHHPYLSNGPHGNAGEYDGLPFIPITNGAGVKDFMDDVVCGNVDVHIAAHDHSLQWLEPTCAGTELIVSGGGSSTTALEGSNPTRFQAESTGFLYVAIDGDTFTGEFIDASGTTLFSRSITKP